MKGCKHVSERECAQDCFLEMKMQPYLFSSYSHSDSVTLKGHTSAVSCVCCAFSDRLFMRLLFMLCASCWLQFPSCMWSDLSAEEVRWKLYSGEHPDANTHVWRVPIYTESCVVGVVLHICALRIKNVTHALCGMLCAWRRQSRWRQKRRRCSRCESYS